MKRAITGLFVALGLAAVVVGAAGGDMTYDSVVAGDEMTYDSVADEDMTYD